MRQVCVSLALTLGLMGPTVISHAANRPPTTVSSRAGTVSVEFTNPWVSAGYDRLSVSVWTADAHLTLYSARLSKPAAAASFFPGILRSVQAQHGDAHACHGPKAASFTGLRGLEYRVCYLDTQGGGHHPALYDEWIATNARGTVVYSYQLWTHTGDLARTRQDMKTGLLAVRWGLH